MNRFLNVVKAHAAAMDRSQAQPRFAIVASVDPANYCARVTLQPEAVLTGWLPILSPWTGAGWGASLPPSPGDQVLVLAQEGDAEHGIIVGRSFTSQNTAPQAAAGELTLQHASGTSFRLTNDGTIHLTGPVQIDGNVHISGTLTANQISDGAGGLDRLRAHYDAHTHPGYAPSLPNPQD